VHWRFFTKLSSSINIQGSISGIPQSLDQCSGEQSAFILELQPMDIVNDILAHVEVCLVYLEQTIIIVFSLHLGELLVLDLTMLAFISLPYTVLHHNFSFPLLDFFLVSSYQAGSLVILDTMTGCSVFSFLLGIFMFFLMFLFSFLGPWNFL
jgi:hypothetical protein